MKLLCGVNLCKLKFECTNKYFFETYCCVVYISETKLLESCINLKITRKHYKSDLSGQSVLTVLKSLATSLKFTLLIIGTIYSRYLNKINMRK